LSLKIIFLFEKFVYIIFFGHFKNDHDFWIIGLLF
jgi:hypothetical protein